MTFLHRVTCIYRNVENFNVSSRNVIGFAPVLELKKASSAIFKMLDDEVDDSVTDLKISVWRLKSTVELSVLPFNSPILQLSRLHEEIELKGQCFPVLKQSIEKIGDLVRWLLDNPDNPKLNEIIQLINNTGHAKNIGIAARLVRGRIPGWDESGWSVFQSLVPQCKRIISVATLRKDLFDLIVVPSGGAAIPFRRELFTSFAAPDITFVNYECEARYIYNNFHLPPGSVKFTHQKKSNKGISKASIVSDAVSVDEWFDKNFWEITRNNLLKVNSDSKSSMDEQFKVKSRLALLGAKKGVYLREDHKVIEISDLIEGRVDLDDSVNKFPRKYVHDLQRGNLIVLRTSGSGDALDDVSTSLMMNDDRFELIENSCEWKEQLRKALEHNGTDVIATMLARHGHQVRDPNYLWMWTTRTVIKPEFKTTFVDLIKVISDLGYENPSTSPEIYACEKWEQMVELIKYRMKAGQKIRVALLQTLREFIKKGIQIEDEYNISLAGVGGGELTIFRVTGVDEISQNVPYSKTGVIGSVET